MKEWWLFAFTYAGAPTLYYGDEVGLSQDGVWDGSRTQDDPYNRAPFPWDDTSGDFTSDTTLLTFARKMASLRLSYPALQDGDVQHGILIDDANQMYGFARTNGSQTALIVLNRDGVPHNATLSGLNASPYNLPNGTVLYDAIEGHTYTVGGGSVTVPVNSTWGVVLVQQNQIQLPTAPAQFTVTQNGSNNDLAWNNVTTDSGSGRELVTQYTVHRSTSAGFTPGVGNQIATVTPPNFGSTNGRVTYTDVNPPAPANAPTTTYYYAVCAQNAGGAQTCTSASTPTAIELVAFTARAKQTRVHLKWQTGSELNVLGFNLLRRQGQGDAWQQRNADLIPAQATGQPVGKNYKFTDKADAGKYAYQLELRRADGTSVLSQPINVQVQQSCLTRPTLLKPDADAEIHTAKVELAWSADGCATQWNVTVRADNPQGRVVFQANALSDPRIVTKKLKPNTTYVWRVAACNADSCTRSAWATFRLAP